MPLRPSPKLSNSSSLLNFAKTLACTKCTCCKNFLFVSSPHSLVPPLPLSPHKFIIQYIDEKIFFSHVITISPCSILLSSPHSTPAFPPHHFQFFVSTKLC